MATSTDSPQGRSDREKRTLRAIGGASTAEALAGMAAVALSILALLAILPFYLMAITTIVLGGGLIVKGGSVAARIRDVMSQAANDREEAAALGTGVSAEVMGGIAGVALGILALLGVVPVTLSAVAAIAFGGALLLGTGAVAQMGDVYRMIHAPPDGAPYDPRTMQAQRAANQLVDSAAGAQTLIGVGVITLGILALLDFSPMTLINVAFLAVGGALLLSGAAVGGRLMHILTSR